MSRAGVRKKDKVGVCVMCRHPFQTSRWDAVTCGDRCRKAWQRYNQDMKREKEMSETKESQTVRLWSLLERVVPVTLVIKS